MLRVPLSSAPPGGLLMGKVVVVDQEGGGAARETPAASNRVIPVELPKTQLDPETREILLNLVSNAPGTEFILLRPEDLPISATTQAATPSSIAESNTYHSSSASALPTDAVASLKRELGINHEVHNSAGFLSPLGADGIGARMSPLNVGNGNLTLDPASFGQGVSQEKVITSSLVARPDFPIFEVAGTNSEGQPLLRSIDTKNLEVSAPTNDAFSMGTYSRISLDDGMRQRSRWGQYSHLSPREKNRQAQRRFRERQKCKVFNLQKEVQRLNAENTCLRTKLGKSQSEKERLVQVVANLMQRVDRETAKSEPA
ncbi:hypothetical protein BSKO_04140 [Bryopsis sp. KO-2023]|nr:hypothetical protein BSKO_04140 [Bryopsis sp. KO-2023]